jgi:hypothetical protein
MKRIVSILIALCLFAISEAQIGRYPVARAQVVGETLGDELVTNGDFASATGWANIGGEWTISGGVASISGIVYAIMLNTTAMCTTGHSYRITYTITAWTSGGFYIGCEGGGTGNTPTRTSTGTWTDDVVAAGTGYIYVACSSDNGTMTIDNISIREIL